MTIANLSRAQLVKKLNARFSPAEIKQTAKILNTLPPGARLGDIPMALGIVPTGSRAEWHRACERIPVMIADALTQGIRGYMRAINRGKGSKFAGPKAIRMRIVAGDMFGLAISQEMTGMRIKLTMRDKPFGKPGS